MNFYNSFQEIAADKTRTGTVSNVLDETTERQIGNAITGAISASQQVLKMFSEESLRDNQKDNNEYGVVGNKVIEAIKALADAKNELYMVGSRQAYQDKLVRSGEEG